MLLSELPWADMNPAAFWLIVIPFGLLIAVVVVGAIETWGNK